MKTYDLVVIGSGPGGYIAAARAGAYGLKTALIEKEKSLGGTCLNKGCIPTKFLLYASEKYEDIQKVKKIGICCSNTNVNWEKLQIYKNNIIKKNSYGIQNMIKLNNVTLYNGRATVMSLYDNKNFVSITNTIQNTIISTKNIILAVGSRSRRKFMNINISGKRILNSDDILNIKKIPKSLVIIGGGVVGCEFASVFSGFNSDITILEGSNRILPMVDRDCSADLSKAFERKGIKIKTNIYLKNIDEKENNVIISYEYKNNVYSIECSHCLVAIGREANINVFSSNINKNDINKFFVNGLFSVNKYMQTKIPRFYAIGDCINTPWLAHVASAEGLLAIDSIKNISDINLTPIDYSKIPKCIYTIPSISWCGISEDEIAISREYIKISKFPLIKNGKAATMLENYGFIKSITDKETNELLGIHILGKNSTELIAEPSFAMQVEATVEEIAHVIHAHPTLYESIYEVALIALGKPLHG